MPRIATLLTHEYPDLDGILAIWLLRRFGRARHPGIEHAPVAFHPAGITVDGEHADLLLARDGVLCVDLGGGPYDHHADQPVPRTPTTDCTATRVAKDLGVDAQPELRKILQFVRRQDVEGRGLSSRDPAEHLISLPNILQGLHLLNGDDFARTVAEVERLLEGLYLTEREWFRALADLEGARRLTLSNGLTVVGVKSGSTKIMKAARHQRFDLTVAVDDRHLVGITPKTSRRLPEPDFRLLARLVRSYELAARSETAPGEDLAGVGMRAGWFLHDSLHILSCGSRKNTQVRPTTLALETLVELVGCAFDPHRVPPPPECPGDRCRGAECPLHVVALPNCTSLQRMTRAAPPSA